MVQVHDSRTKQRVADRWRDPTSSLTSDSSGVASFGGPKCLTLGQQQYFLGEVASQSTK